MSEHRIKEFQFELADATVTVTVSRSNALPVFQNLPYTQSVNEDTANGTVIFTVSATEQGLQGTMTYSINGFDPAPQFFSIGATSGQVKVASNLKADRGLKYTVILFLNFS